MENDIKNTRKVQQKEQTENLNGKSVDNKNDYSAELEVRMKLIVINLIVQIIKNLMEIEPEKRMALIEKIFSYIFPNVQFKRDKIKKDVTQNKS